MLDPEPLLAYDAAPLAGLDLRHLPAGLQVMDAWLKQAAAEVLFADDIEPGRWLLLVTGDLAALQEGLRVGLEVGGPDVVGQLWLPQAHGQLLAALRGQVLAPAQAVAAELALGTIQSSDLLALLAATDRALKADAVALLRLRLAGGLHGQGHVALAGEYHAVLAGLAAARDGTESADWHERVLPRPLPEVLVAAGLPLPGQRALRAIGR